MVSGWFSGATRAVALLIGIHVAWIGCKEDPGGSPSVGSNSNWFRSCTAGDDCDGLRCVCGACGRACASDEDCADLAGGHCVPNDSAAAEVQCSVPPGAEGICLPSCVPGQCDANQACVSDSCVLLEMPDGAFCAAAADPGREDRRNEDELLAALDALHAEGGGSCGGEAVAPAPSLRLDPRLTCVARVRALDIYDVGSVQPLDSQGRSPEERLGEVGYPATLWAESYAVDATNAARALMLMRQDAASCARLSDPAYAAVGVGVVSGVFVVMLGGD